MATARSRASVCIREDYSSERAMQYVVLINSLVYVSEGMRAALMPSVPHMPVVAMLAALVAICVLFFWLGLRAFGRRAIS